MTNEENIYDPAFVSRLFDEMSATYGLVNYVSSFGFCERWRRACVSSAAIEPGMTVYDLMTGMGECWHLINERLCGSGRLIALDISTVMCQRAAAQQDRVDIVGADLIQADILNNSLTDSSADCVVSCFGIKTFSDEQKRAVAAEIARILKPGGKFSLVEISVPTNVLLKVPYMAYLKYGIPAMGKLFLGNPDNYRLLGVYTERFRDCRMMGELLNASGLKVEDTDLFFGCATLLRGCKGGRNNDTTTVPRYG